MTKDLENEYDLLNSRIQVLEGMTKKDQAALAGRKGISLAYVLVEDWPVAIAHAEAERIGIRQTDPGKLMKGRREKDAILHDGRPIDPQVKANQETLIAHIQQMKREVRTAVDQDDVGPCPYDIETSSGWFIYEVILPELLRHFFEKNASYGDQHRYGLGPKAEWVGIDRKIHKLERVLWDGHEVAEGHESAEVMLYEIVGQVFLILDLLAGNHKPRGRSAE